MPCFHPISVNKRGFSDLHITVACGRCIGCRIDKARDWATRCIHEAQLHDESWFVTLTYDDTHLPPGASLRPKDYTDFMKRLRKAREPSKIRFLQCGEYGGRNHRPHHHALLFGVSFPDRKPVPGSADEGKPRWTSEELNRIWSNGNTDIGVVNHKTAAYCARYILKKITGDRAETHYRFVDPSTGEVFQRVPEYATMSRRPGLGHGWLRQYFSDVFPDDFIALRDGKQVPVPPYYDKQLQEVDPELFDRIKAARLAYALEPRQQKNSTPARLRVREEVATAATNLQPRKL